MIDLHLHTKHSDGYYTVKELIEILNKNNIKYASITDHNSIDGIKEYKDNNYQELYNGTMINGVEIQTLVDGYLIEVLVYNYDIDMFDEYIKTTKKTFWEFHNKAYKELISKAKKLGLKYTEPEKDLQNGYYCNMKFQEAIANHTEYNKNIIPERVLTDHLYFYRHEFQNPESMFFVDNTKAFPRLEDVITEAHKCKAIVFLAHIDEYQAISNKDEFLDNLFTNYQLDGIEVYHPSINETNRKRYIEFAKEHNLMMSAGSDFHGPHLFHRQKITTEAKSEEINWLN